MSKQNRDRKNSQGQQQQGGGKSRQQQQGGQPEQFDQVQGENREQDYEAEVGEQHRQQRNERE
ncbi:MAG TPA: hypothetical protein VJU83_03795 [Burkholderiales bacterium]|nr:hypothetical protein [Burkholderiales bacterium]